MKNSEDGKNENLQPNPQAGQSLGGGSLTPPLTQEEMRRRRLEALEQTKSRILPKAKSLPASLMQVSTTNETNKPSPQTASTSKKTPVASDASAFAGRKTPNQWQVDPSSILLPEPTSYEHTPMITSPVPTPAPADEMDFQVLGGDEEDTNMQAALATSLANANHSDVSTSQDIDSEDEEQQLAAALHLSLQSSEQPSTKPILTSTDTWSPSIRRWFHSAQPCNILDFHCLMWDPSVTTDNDKRRWMAQGIIFKTEDVNPVSESKESLLAAMVTNHSWGLTQEHGGPCGVLAAIQAEFLRLLLFGPRQSSSGDSNLLYSIDFPTSLENKLVRDKPDLSPLILKQGLALAMGMILARASWKASATLHDHDDPSTLKEQEMSQTTDYYLGKIPQIIIAVPKSTIISNELEWEHLHPWSSNMGGSPLSDHLVTYTLSIKEEGNNFTTKRPKLSNENNKINAASEDSVIMELARGAAQFILETNIIEWFQRPGGVLLFVMSLSLSRGMPNVQGDMDDCTAKLTTNFGHCSQELINLLLTGQAVSNVFDHTLRPSGELICRGIQEKPDIGYLTQLEAMRYLEVGGFYKTPKFPIWVVGSTSHFTVMFGDAACLKESESDILLEKVRRAFKRMEGGAEENGFIQSHQLGQFLKSLNLNYSDHGVSTLAATMEVHGAGIILWEDLWKQTSRVLTGASLDAVLSVKGGPSPLIQTFAAGPTAPDQLSDEELARQLQAEWNGEPVVIPPSSSAVPSSMNNAHKETYGNTFQLYHYNGLRGGNLRCFRVTRLSADEAIGASVALGNTQGPMSMMDGSGNLEDVLRCKWPSCKVDWTGASPASID
jgi:hypothetical protein